VRVIHSADQPTHLDQSANPLFGDAGSATIIERTGINEPWDFLLGTDGQLASAIKVPAGGARMPYSDQTRKEIKNSEGNIQHPENLIMEGAEVFNFSLREVPSALQTVIKNASWTSGSVDVVFLHQANKFIIENIAKKVGLDLARVPAHLVEKYGNQSSASLPAVMTDFFLKNQIQRNQKLSDVDSGLVYLGPPLLHKWSQSSLVLFNLILLNMAEPLTNRFKALQKDVDIFAQAQLDTPLSSLSQWDSLAVLLVISHLENNYKILFSGQQIRKCKTPREILELLPI
jgi:acyl carrier protein